MTDESNLRTRSNRKTGMWKTVNAGVLIATSMCIAAVTEAVLSIELSAVNPYTLTYLTGPNGKIRGTSPQTVGHGFDGTQVFAEPDQNYRFAGWNDGSIQNPRYDTNVTASATYTAFFALNQYTLTYLTDSNGTISGSALQTVNHSSSGTAVTAVPNSGYKFVNWSDGSTANPRTDTNVTMNILATANFAPVNPASFLVNSTADPGTGICDAMECTLREAIAGANADPNADTIGFDADVFAAPGTYTIELSGPLPELISDLTIDGPGAGVLTVRRDVGGDYRVFTVGRSRTVTISGLTITNGRVTGTDLDGNGGGILNQGTLTLVNSVVSDNWAFFCGGGICNWGDVATAHVINSTVTGNNSEFNGGGIENRNILTVQDSTVSGNSAFWDGGGIQNATFVTSCTVINSLITGNNAGGAGGGISSGSPLTLTNSTVSGNRAAQEGGGIFNENLLQVTSTTITNNRSDVNDNGGENGGGLYNYRDNAPLLQNTIVAGNYRGSTNLTADDIGYRSSFLVNPSSSFNLIGTGGSGGLTDGVDNNQVGVASPGLGPLRNNGGPTETHGLLAGSPAIDQGNSFGLATDQRGSPRPSDDSGITNASGGDGSDIGAFEMPQPDADGDGVTDARDNCPTTPNPNQADNDNDGQGDACDPDDDNDRQTDDDEIACGSNPFDAASRAPDNDADDLPDCVDPDDDNDGVLDASDNCQFTPNPDQADADGDGTGDVCDPTPKPDIISSLVVNSVNDPDVGVCDVAECTLREAIMAANADGGAESITFDIPGNGPHIIQLDSSLPALSDSVNITNTSGERITVRGEGSTELYRIFTINTGQTVTISGLTITKGDTTSGPLAIGGGIYNQGTLTLTNSTVSGNSAMFGGGIYNTGTLNLTNSVVRDNSANGTGNVQFTGGGIYNSGTLTLTDSTVSGNSSALDSGGIYNSGTLTLTDSTVSGNNAARLGGGLDNVLGTITLRNSTVSGNSCGYRGGGVYNAATLNLISATVTNNRADANGTGNFQLTGGGIYFGDFGSPPLLQNSIVADNYRGTANATEDDIQSLLGTSLNPASSFNLIGTGGSGGLTSGTNGNQVGVANPGLAPLADNGGPTETHALMPGSPAIDQGAGFGLATDQRGFLRPFDIDSIPNAADGSDIGAYESNLTPIGTNVSVTAGLVTITYSGVSQVGETTVTEIDPATAGTLPGGYSLGQGMPAFEITTTAVYTPPITVCFYLPGITDEATFGSIRILHGEGGSLVDRTILPPDPKEPNFATKTICARVDSLSPFVVAQLEMPIYSFSGFLQPVQNLPTVNLVAAGAQVPIRFSLGGDRGLAILAGGSPTSSPIVCDAAGPGPVIEPTVSPGNSGLTYDAATDQYTYIWKTDKAWKGTCRMLVVRFNDGSEHYAKFQFR